MKRLNCRFALILALALGFSAAAYADTLPVGATRFNLYSGSPRVDVPEGTILVLTDVVVGGGGGAYCVFDDGDERKLIVGNPPSGTSHLNLQTGIEFRTQLRTENSCNFLTLSGYWMDAK